MAHDHVGIPKFIEKGFSDKGLVCVSNLKSNKSYFEKIDRLGTENNYYDIDVEKELLANGIEYNFSEFYRDFCNSRDVKFMKRLLDSNIELVEQFFSFMFLRSKKILKQINDESITSRLLGDVDHSELLRIQTVIRINPLEMIGKRIYAYPIINFSKLLFINNSIGIGFMKSKNNKYSAIIPLNSRLGILITANKEQYNDFVIIGQKEDKQADYLNKCIMKIENEIGNGFFFGRDENKIHEYTDYFNKNLLK